MQRPLSTVILTAGVIFLSFAEHLQAQAPKEITNSIGIKLVLIPKGTFIMGSPIEEGGASDEVEQHEVTISNDYFLGVTEVTQGQYEKVMGINPSKFQKQIIRMSDGSMHPVEQVSFEDALAFCERLSGLPEEKKAGRMYRLPTEAEWEYACRAGSRTRYSFGESSQSLGDNAWYRVNSNKQTQPIGKKKPNIWGLYDMHGNVYEWCNDWNGEYPKRAVSDPTGPIEGTFRVSRGGCWIDFAEECRSANRNWFLPTLRSSFVGFRIALTSSETPQGSDELKR